MSPRRNRPKGARKAASEDARIEVPNLVVGAPPGWQVRVVQPARAVKQYICPGCNQYINVGLKHIVAWREDEGDMRRHWHTSCWEHQQRR